MSSDQITNPCRSGWMRRIGRVLLVILVILMLTGMTVWGTLFLWLSNLPGEPIRIALAGIFAIGTLASFLFLKKRWRTLLVFLGVFAVLVIWFFSLRPSNNRQWVTEDAVLATATVNGHLVEIKSIRNFDYRTETDFTPRYYDKTFDLDKLESVDLITVYWGSPAIAHVIASFGFGGNDFVAFSIELRPEKNEINSFIRTFFRKFELMYVVADERDVIRVRTNYRQPHEEVHIYRTRLPIENQRKLFLSYVDKVNALAKTPEWYNTIQDNCTTGVLQRTRAYQRRGRYNWKILLSGYAAEYAYDIGMLDIRIPFAELSRRCLVNAKAEAADKAEDFSLRIREGLPMPKPLTLQEFQSGSY
jgi:hypothetical protein